MTHIDFFKPIKIWGYVFIAMGVVHVLIHFSLLENHNYTIGFMYFVLISSFIHLLVGVGIVCKRKWGLSIFRCYLYTLYPGFPVGSYLAWKTLGYIKKHQIEKYCS